MNAEAKIRNVEAQMKAVLRGDTNVITCPYCKAQNRQPSALTEELPSALCCILFADCVNAVMLSMETSNALDAAHMIAEQAVKDASAN